MAKRKNNKKNDDLLTRRQVTEIIGTMLKNEQTILGSVHRLEALIFSLVKKNIDAGRLSLDELEQIAGHLARVSNLEEFWQCDVSAPAVVETAEEDSDEPTQDDIEELAQLSSVSPGA